MSAMNKAIGNDVVLLTSDHIRRWQEELREHEIKIAELRKKLEAAAVLVGAGSSPSAEAESVESVETDDRQESMGDAATRLLAAFSKLVSHPELQTELRKIPRFREMLDKNPAYYYTMIARLVKKRDAKVKKVGRKLRLIRKNEAPPEETSEGAS
jgi:hypothetical protein